jgi:hypothetical protein
MMLKSVVGNFEAYAANENMFLTMNAATKNVTLYGLDSVFLTSSNSVLVNAQSNVVVNALNGEMSMYAQSNLRLTAHDSNMFIHMNRSGDNMSLYSLSNVYASASNNMFLSAASNLTLSASNISFEVKSGLAFSSCNDMQITAKQALIMNSASVSSTTSGDQQYTAQSNMKFYITSSSNQAVDPVFTVMNDQIIVRGDIVVTGSINTSNVYNTTVIQETLKVSDKTLTLANLGSNFSPGDGPSDGVANSGAGIKIDGVPAGYDATISNAYEKSLTWNYGSGNGIASLGSANMDNDPTWDLKGGSFRMIHQKIISGGGSNIIRNISFNFRMNDQEELELVKTSWDDSRSAYVSKRVARFGRLL